MLSLTAIRSDLAERSNTLLSPIGRQLAEKMLKRYVTYDRLLAQPLHSRFAHFAYHSSRIANEERVEHGLFEALVDFALALCNDRIVSSYYSYRHSVRRAK